MDRLSELLPELQEWNHGRGIAPTDWLVTFARSDQAMAYAALFWPTFAVIDDHVLRTPVTPEKFKRWKNNVVSTERSEREALWNTLYLGDSLFHGEPRSPLLDERSRYLGKVLAEIHVTKLARDFPDRRFVVEFWDGTEPEHGGEISLSFWQQA